jgi:hypothetical protein
MRVRIPSVSGQDGAAGQSEPWACAGTERMMFTDGARNLLFRTDVVPTGELVGATRATATRVKHVTYCRGGTPAKSSRHKLCRARTWTQPAVLPGGPAEVSALGGVAGKPFGIAESGVPSGRCWGATASRSCALGCSVRTC